MPQMIESSPIWIFLLTLALSTIAAAQTLDAAPGTSTPLAARTEFHIRYINGTSVYIDGGRSAGLAEGMQLLLRQDAAITQSGPETPIEPGILAKLTIVSVASTSAVCDIVKTSRELKVGDLVSLPHLEIKKQQERHVLSGTRAYPMVISFTEGDPLDEEVRDAMAHPPLVEINEVRGRIGFDISTIRSLDGSSTTSTSIGMVARADITRIRGTHWNLNGYWRGTLQLASTPTRSTIQDLINRTYLMSLSYVNSESSWVAGVGRLYIPWASSLETIDGGYLGRHLSSSATVGIFGGSTPDPTAWNYNPNREIAGSYVNIRSGTYEGTMISSTAGFGVDMLSWNVDRPFLFTENQFSYKRYVSAYHSMQIDRPTANAAAPDIPMGLGRSLLSLRLQVHPRVSLDLSHTYFRDVPTFDPILVGTGLLDKYLYQGLNAGARVSLPLHVAAYFSLGSSSNSTDAKSSSNSMYGITFSKIWNTRLSADARHSRFDSVFATGTYDTVTISRELSDRIGLNLQGGRQSFTSTFANNSNAYFGNISADLNLGARYFLQTDYTTQRGGSQDYQQLLLIFGYRFDNRAALRRAAHANHP